MRAAVFATFIAASSCGFAYSATDDGLRVVFPNLGLSKNQELVEAVHVFVSCGHIESVSAVPMDWTIQIVQMNAGEEQMQATAGHGASRLWVLGKFNGGVRVVPLDLKCFDVHSKIFISGERTREIAFQRRELKLLP